MISSHFYFHTGSLCSNDFSNECPVIKFKKIKGSLPDLSSDVIKDLSKDQRQLYEYTKGITSGHMSPQFARQKIGPLHHARWLTLAVRLMALYTRGLPDTHKECTTSLKEIVTFIVQVYSPCWFLIKQDNKFHNQPKHTHFAIQQSQKQPQHIRDIALSSLQRNAFGLMPENFILSLTQSDIKVNRSKGIHKILEIRESAVQRIKKIPTVRLHVKRWANLIDLDQPGITESPLNMHLSTEYLQSCLGSNKNIDVLKMPRHSQSVERAVYLVTESSHAVFGVEARHMFVNATCNCCQPHGSPGI